MRCTWIATSSRSRSSASQRVPTRRDRPGKSYGARAVRRAGRGEDDLFDPNLAGELDTLVFEVMQTAEIAWKLLDDANLDYSRRLEAHEEAQQPVGDDE